MQLQFTYDQATSSLPAGFVTAMNAVAAYFDSLITDNITVTIQVGYGEITLGGASTPVPSGAEGGPDNGYIYTYNEFKNFLAANSGSPTAQSVLANLPATDPTGGQGVYLSEAQARAFGLVATDSTAVDGAIGFQLNGAGITYNFDPNNRAVSGQWDFIGVAEHEVAHALGRVNDLVNGDYSLLDLLTYTAPGVLQSSTTQQGYFSINGGLNPSTSKQFSLTSDPGDWAGSTPDSFNAFGSTGVANVVTPIDMTLMNALGFDTSTAMSDASALAYKTTYEAVWNSGTGALQIIDSAKGGAVVDTLGFSGVTLSGQLVALSSDGAGGTAVGLAPLELVTVAAGDLVTSGIQGQAYSSYETLYSYGVFQGVDYFFTNTSGAAYSAYEYEFSAGNHQVGSKFLYTTGLSALPYANEEIDYDGAGRLTRQYFWGLASDNNAPISPGGQVYSNYEYDFVGGVYAGSLFNYFTVPAGAAYSSFQTSYDQAGKFNGEKFYFTAVSSQPYTSEEADYDASVALSRVLLSGFATQPYNSLELDYSAGTYTGYKAFYAGGNGASYATQEVDVSASGQLQKVIFSGLTNSPYASVENDYANNALAGTIYDFENVTGAAYHAYQVKENAAGSTLQETLDYDSGGHAEIGFANSQTLVGLGNDTMTGGGTGETFVLAPVFGAAVITDFSTDFTAGNTDVLQLAKSEFNGFAALVKDAASSSGGVMISATNGDNITLNGVTMSELQGLNAATQSYFKFV